MAEGILLLGRCGLERVAGPLRELTGAQVTVAGWTQVELIDRLEPALVYVDLFGWDTVGPLTAAALSDRAPSVDPAPLRAVVAALDARDERAHIVYRGLRRPSAGAFGLLASHEGLDAALDDLAALVDGRRVLDVAGLWARVGVVLDDVAFGMGHGEAGVDGARHEAAWLGALWQARVHGPVKCVVVDLDDTLIHGQVAADDFHEKIPAWLPEGESATRPLLEGWWRLRRGLHEALRLVARRGIVLAMATRNDPEVVRRRWRRRPAVADRDPGAYAWMYDDLPDGVRESALLAHPEILEAVALGPDDMVVVEAGFGAKSSMCRAIAARLGIGLDTLAFLDDSPVEREEVRRNAPEVFVVDGPVSGFREQLLLGPRFTTLGVSPAASLRAASYRSRAAVTGHEDTSPAALEDFLHELELEVDVRAAHLGDLYRVNELLARTHQLNLTGLRLELTAADLDGVYVATCRDRLADHGLVAAGVFRDDALEAWVCSCRVLPHRVAATILGAMLAREPGAAATRVATARNGATVGLLEEARAGAAAWVRVTQA